MAEYKPHDVQSPGKLLKRVLDELEIAYEDFRERAGIDSEFYERFLLGKAELTEMLACRLERWVKVPAWLWVRTERRYREHLARMEDINEA